MDMQIKHGNMDMKMNHGHIDTHTSHVHTQMERNNGRMDMKGGMKMDMMMMMTPRWFTMKTSTDFLIENVHIDTPGGILLAMLFAILLTILYDSANIVIQSKAAKIKKSNVRNMTSKIPTLAVITFLRMISLTASYVAMLCAMTFNLWLLVAVVLASGVGHHVIRPILLKWLQVDNKQILNAKDKLTDREHEPLHDFVNEIKTETSTDTKHAEVTYIEDVETNLLQDNWNT